MLDFLQGCSSVFNILGKEAIASSVLAVTLRVLLGRFFLRHIVNFLIVGAVVTTADSIMGKDNAERQKDILNWMVVAWVGFELFSSIITGIFSS